MPSNHTETDVDVETLVETVGTIRACPSCGSAKAYRRVCLRPPWRCQECGATYAEPIVRIRGAKTTDDRFVVDGPGVDHDG